MSLHTVNQKSFFPGNSVRPVPLAVVPLAVYCTWYLQYQKQAGFFPPCVRFLYLLSSLSDTYASLWPWKLRMWKSSSIPKYSNTWKGKQLQVQPWWAMTIFLVYLKGYGYSSSRLNQKCFPCASVFILCSRYFHFHVLISMLWQMCRSSQNSIIHSLDNR